ncbi:MAG: class I SAM-dependent RNA methyltransferase [Lachnospiraceae bacterium]|nr:class I SAM-dependent RNA methyltransferase [Lachnospiraceae bacterium]
MWTYVAPCHFGLEAVCKREIQNLGYEVSRVEDGRVFFEGDAQAGVLANLCLRTAERVLLIAGEFTATSYEELFEATKALPWEAYLPRDGRFWVSKATSIRSQLFSPSDIQSIMKKAMVERMKSAYHLTIFPETGAAFPIRVGILKDKVSVGLDLSGESLHKRGYRKLVSKAPITETLAAALLDLTPWRADRILVDPFCGSGTFAIEAAMKAAGMAPGLKRSFAAEAWPRLFPGKLWDDAREELREEMDLTLRPDIQAYDIDSEVVKAARDNARLAGVEEMIHFQVRDVKDLSHSKKYGFILTNPPYGERLEEKEALPALYRTLGERFAALDSWSAYVITAYDGIEKDFGRKADKNRKIYNGMMKTYFYEFRGPKPPLALSRTQERDVSEADRVRATKG